MKSVAETVIFCGRQVIALRGHRDDWTQVEKLSEVNPGNFISLLYFRVESGDQVLANHLQSGGHRLNALYTSKTTQNELIDVCGFIICTFILIQVRAARFFSIMVDKAMDSANDEQLAVSVRYVNPSSRAIEERFIGFSECLTGISGEAIADHILKLLGE